MSNPDACYNCGGTLVHMDGCTAIYVPAEPAGESFTNQKPFVVTATHLGYRWGGYADGRKFRCYLCGKKFTVGDTVRWIFMHGRCGNPFVDAACDGDDVVERILKHRADGEQRFWWMRHA